MQTAPPRVGTVCRRQRPGWHQATRTRSSASCSSWASSPVPPSTASRTALTEVQFDEAAEADRRVEGGAGGVAGRNCKSNATRIWKRFCQPSAQQRKPTLTQLLFTERTEPWIAPIIDRDPKVPLSESAVIAPFDGVRNYLQWLSQVSLNDLESERFVGADGRHDRATDGTALRAPALRVAHGGRRGQRSRSRRRPATDSLT